MKFDQHSLFEDSEDEKKLNKLPETEKEKILYERHLKLQKLKEKKEMDLKMKERQKNKTIKAEKKIQELPRLGNEDFTYDEMNKILIKRDQLVNNIYRPCLDDCIGQYVRVRFETGYAIREILGIIRKEPYDLKNYEGRKARTNKYIKVQKTADTIETLPIFTISNSKLEHIEFDYFKKKKPNFPIKKLKIKHQKFENAISKPISQIEKNQINEERQKHNEMPFQRIWDKVKLIREQDEAFKSGDKAKYVKLHKQISQMDDEERDPAEEAERKIWERINKKNKQINFEKGISNYKVKDDASSDISPSKK